jgi:hypothetical protein
VPPSLRHLPAPSREEQPQGLLTVETGLLTVETGLLTIETTFTISLVISILMVYYNTLYYQVTVNG